MFLFCFKALKLIQVRSKAIYECSQLVTSGMMTVRVTAASRLNDAIFDAKEAARFI